MSSLRQTESDLFYASMATKATRGTVATDSSIISSLAISYYHCFKHLLFEIGLPSHLPSCNRVCSLSLHYLFWTSSVQISTVH